MRDKGAGSWETMEQKMGVKTKEQEVWDHWDKELVERGTGSW